MKTSLWPTSATQAFAKDTITSKQAKDNATQAVCLGSLMKSQPLSGLWMLRWAPCMSFCSLEAKAKTAETEICHPYSRHQMTRMFLVDGPALVAAHKGIQQSSFPRGRREVSLDPKTVTVWARRYFSQFLYWFFGDGRIAQFVKCLLCKHEAPSSIPRRHIRKKSQVWRYVFIISAPGMWREESHYC